MRKSGLGKKDFAQTRSISELLEDMRASRLSRRAPAHQEFAAYAREHVTWPTFTRPSNDGLKQVENEREGRGEPAG